MSGLISDTLLLKSPTTHPTDFKVAEELAEIAGVNLETYGLALLKAGTNLATKSAVELIDIDAKTFELNGGAVRVAQVKQLILQKFWNVKTRLNQLSIQLSQQMAILTLFS